MAKEIHRGDMFYITTSHSIGSEQGNNRPGIIVSSESLNASAEVVEIVFLTTRAKSSLPTHIEVASAPRRSIALCEQITTVSVSRLTKYIGRITNAEAEALDQALALSLSLKYSEPPEVVRSKTTAEIYKQLYEQAQSLLYPFPASVCWSLNDAIRAYEGTELSNEEIKSWWLQHRLQFETEMYKRGKEILAERLQKR